MNFIKYDLKNVNRTGIPLVIAYAYRPIHCSADLNLVFRCGPVPRENTQSRLLRTFEDVFYPHKVNLLLYDHVHAYRGKAPVYNNQII